MKIDIIDENKTLGDKGNRKPPVLYTDKSNCCGCSACYAVCPVNAITMEEDSEGFLYPSIDQAKCVRCYMCQKVCAFKADQTGKGYYR